MKNFMKPMLAFSILLVGLSASATEGLRTRYALTFGGDTAPIAQFVLGDSYLSVAGGSLYWYNESEAAKKFSKVPDDIAPYVDIYRKMRYGQDKTVAGGGLKLTLNSLAPNTEHKLRLHSIEFWNGDVGKRTFAVYVNDTRMDAPADGVFDLVRDAGKHVPHYYDIPNVYSTADGKMSIFLSNVVDKLVLCGLELFEPTNAPCYKPTPTVKGFTEFAYLNLETKDHRGATGLYYDIQCRDGGDEAEVKTFATRVCGNVVYDTTPATGVTRAYRVRMSQEGNELWSDWISAARTTSALTDGAGRQLLPVPAEEYERTGVVSVFHRNASDADTDATNEVAVTETVTKNELVWTQTDVPASCTGDQAPARILTSGKIFFPYMVKDCRIAVRGTGMVNLWLDNGWMKTTLLNGGVVTNTFAYAKITGNLTGKSHTNTCVGEVGLHDFYVEQLQAADTDIATSVAFIDDEGQEIPVRLYPSDFTADISPWKYHQLHARQWQYQADAYVVPLDEARTSFRIYGSGNSTWGTTDGGSVLYQSLKGGFEIQMRINSIGDIYDKDCRYGFALRGGLGTAAADKFLVVAGYNPRGGIRPMVFADADLSNDMDIGAPLSGKEGQYTKYPIWLKLVATTGADADGKRVLNYDYLMSSDGETWTSYYKGSVPRAADTLVGPIIVASKLLGTITPWIDIDNLELTDNAVAPLILIIR